MTTGDAKHWFELGLNYLDEGRGDEAESAFRKVLALDPRHAKANANLGMLLQRLRNDAEAECFYRAAVESDAGLAQAWFNLGTLLLDGSRISDAVDCFRRAVALEGSRAVWHSALGSTLREAGDSEGSRAAERRAREVSPGAPVFPSDSQHVLDLAAGATPAKIFEEHIAWARRHSVIERGAAHENDPDPARKLRLGYVAPDFNDPTLACLIEPVLQHRERSAFEVLCYSDAEIESSDAWRMRDLADLWHATADMSNDRLAERIREDRIDILVDLAGHSARGRRIAVLAQKPAPLQISWLGFPCASGMDLMDYRITDYHLCPPEEERLSKERALCMPGSRWCFTPPVDAPEPGPVPLTANGSPTFGSFRDLSVLSRHTIALWASVLRALPKSTFLIAARGAPEVAAAMGERFREEGVDSARIVLRDRDPAASALALYGEVDISLDASPCAGIVTTFESIWMGVPVVTLRGDTEESRNGASILAEAGMETLVAGSDDEYVRLAVSLAADPQRLAELRRGLRSRLMRSPLTNAQRFTAQLEALYREAWRTWCAGRSRRPEAVRQSAAAAIAARPRVMVDCVFFQYYDTGIARVWRTLFDEWRKSGFAKHVLLLDRAGTAPRIPGLQMRTVPRHSYDQLEQDRAMLQAVCEEERATVFVSTYYSGPLATPVVMMVHDMNAEVLEADLTEPVWREKAHCIGRASRFVAVSRSTARDLCRIYPGLPPGRITVAHSGVDPVFRPAGAAQVDEFRQRHGLSWPYFLLVGSQPSYKNARTFFRALAQLPKRSRYGVLCVGSMAELSPAQKAACADSPIKRLALSDEDLSLGYSGAVALVYPSLYEGFGLPVIEALACGCPVITTSHSSLPEVAGDAAIYVNPFDYGSLAAAMVRIQEPKRRATLFARGLARAQLFSWTAMAHSVAAVLSDV